MAIATYTDVSDFITGQGITLRTGAGTAFVQARLNAAEAYFLRQTSRSYGANVTETRKFDGSGTERIPIDPCLSVTAIRSMSLGTTVYTYVATDYALYPANRSPKVELRRVAQAGSSIRDYLAAYATPDHIYTWPAGEQNIEVDGTWGDNAAIPGDVKEAVVILATLYVLAGNALPSVSGTVTAALRSYSTGVYKAEFANDAKEVMSIVTNWGQTVQDTLNAHKLMRIY